MDKTQKNFSFSVFLSSSLRFALLDQSVSQSASSDSPKNIDVKSLTVETIGAKLHDKKIMQFSFSHTVPSHNIFKRQERGFPKFYDKAFYVPTYK